MPNPGGERFVSYTEARHPPLTEPPQESGITRVDQADQYRLRRNEVMAECDGFRSFLENIYVLRREVQRSPFAGFETELTGQEGRPPVVTREMVDTKKNPIKSMAKIEQAIQEEYPSEIASLLAFIHKGIYKNHVLQAFGIEAPASAQDFPPRQEWNWQTLSAYLERAERFLILHLPEFFDYARVLRREAERLDHKFPAQHMSDLERMLQASVLQARNAKIYEELVTDRRSTPTAELNQLERDRQRLFQQKGNTFVTLASYLEEIVAPLRREREMEEEASQAEDEPLAHIPRTA